MLPSLSTLGGLLASFAGQLALAISFEQPVESSSSLQSQVPKRPNLHKSFALLVNVYRGLQTYHVRPILPLFVSSIDHHLAGAVVSSQGLPVNLVLLPGQYSSSTNPQLLHDILSSPSSRISFSPGFGDSSSRDIQLPLNLQLQPGVATYTQSRYSGDSNFVPISNSTGQSPPRALSASSLLISSNTFAIVSSASSSSSVSHVLWDSVPSVSDLPSTLSPGNLNLLDLQSASCSPACAGSATCSSQGSCICPPGFTGTACEACAPGFFGSSCQACPTDCPDSTTCDDGISGSGRCRSRTVPNAPESCNCVNGVCGTNGQCACNDGWTTGTDGRQCSACAQGFFLTDSGDCKGSCQIRVLSIFSLLLVLVRCLHVFVVACSIGCASCTPSSGVCTACSPGFTLNANDRTSCLPPQSVTSTGTVCPDGSFASGATCQQCSPLCQTCTGPTSEECVVCGGGRVKTPAGQGGTCVNTDAQGVCAGTRLVADNNKRECDGQSYYLQYYSCL